METNDLTPTAVAVAAVTAISKDTYNDVVHPSFDVLGDAIAGPFKLLALPLRLMGSAADVLKEKGDAWIQDKLKNVSPENQVSPKLNVAVPVLQNLLYNVDEEKLRDAFLNLLANAMSKNTASRVHPSFPHILEEMSPLDAVFLKEMASRRIVPTANIQSEEPGKNSSMTLIKHFVVSQSITDFDQLVITIDNLLRLKLLEIPVGRIFTEPIVYKPIEDHLVVAKLKKHHDPKRQISLDKGILEITDMGSRFSQVVLQPPRS